MFDPMFRTSPAVVRLQQQMQSRVGTATSTGTGTGAGTGAGATTGAGARSAARVENPAELLRAYRRGERYLARWDVFETVALA